MERLSSPTFRKTGLRAAIVLFGLMLIAAKCDPVTKTTVGGIVFNDVNFNSVYDSGDTPLAGVTIDYYAFGPTQTDDCLVGIDYMESVTSGGDGQYITMAKDMRQPKTGCPRGFFVIWVTCPDGMTLNKGAAGWIDPDLAGWLAPGRYPDYLIAMPTTNRYSITANLALTLNIACTGKKVEAGPTSPATPTATTIPPVGISFPSAVYCRVGPATTFSTATLIPAGYSTEALGLNGTDQRWFMIDNPNGTGQCWVPRSVVTVTGGDPIYLTIYTDPPTPTPAPEPVYVEPPTADPGSGGGTISYCLCYAPVMGCYDCAAVCGGVGDACTP
jgi:hypothetical protein